MWGGCAIGTQSQDDLVRARRKLVRYMEHQQQLAGKIRELKAALSGATNAKATGAAVPSIAGGELVGKNNSGKGAGLSARVTRKLEDISKVAHQVTEASQRLEVAISLLERLVNVTGPSGSGADGSGSAQGASATDLTRMLSNLSGLLAGAGNPALAGALPQGGTMAGQATVPGAPPPGLLPTANAVAPTAAGTAGAGAAGADTAGAGAAAANPTATMTALGPLLQQVAGRLEPDKAQQLIGLLPLLQQLSAGTGSSGARPTT